MGKKNRRKNKKVSSNGKPFVSVCTPTYNRRMFLPQLIKCFQKQTYPKELMEWIIIDDSDEPVGDLFEGVECVKYFRYEEKIKLGRKRNLMHEKSKGDIIVYMDDDDYYPPERVTHAVDRLRARPEALAAGSSVVYIYFNDLDTLYQFGPYGPNHATAGTFAFKRKLLEQTRYDDDAEIAEEKAFLKNYTIPFAQLDPKKCILVFAHQYNTFDKRKLLENPHPDYVKKTNMSPAIICRDLEMLKFYKSI
jgi:glycosyltransferase involved in cell wall biosynthesis